MIHYEGQEKACNFTLRMPETMKNRIKEIARRENITPTFFIRQSIEKNLTEDDLKQKLKENPPSK
jgi:predicted DNA-binding protein